MTLCNREDCDKEAKPGRQGRCSTHYWQDYRASRRDELNANYKAWAKARGSRWKLMSEGQRTYQRVRGAAKRAAECGAEVLTFTERDHARLYRRQGKKCAYCAKPSKKTLQMDHVIPLVAGGRHAIGNIVLACADCNKLKGGMTVMEWRLAKKIGKYPPRRNYDLNWGTEPL